MHAPPPAPDASALAAAYAAAGRWEEASQEVEVALEAHPDDPALQRQAATIYRALSQPGVAVSHLEAALRLAPEDVESWLELAQLEAERGNTPDAYIAYRQATRLAPDDIRAVSGLALTADALGFDEEASRSYARWAELERQRQQDMEH